MSAVDASITALVTLATMFFMLDWRMHTRCDYSIAATCDCDEYRGSQSIRAMRRNHKKLSPY